MRLIKFEAQGFKSFADKVTLTFDGGVVGVVGPNGSGKSNVNDAFKWALGEISAKSLRGDSMEDIIFSGSKTVPAMDEAIVSLTFDNSEKQVSLPYKHFTISRILKRGKISEYYINGQLARLKDIREIAMESGISKTSLAIISQGTVQDIAQATPEQLRLVFEQVAGVTKYKMRKDEALRKLVKTSESLDRLTAITQELFRQLQPLKRQKEKAQIYLQKRQALCDIEVRLIVEDIIFNRQKIEMLNEKLIGAKTKQRFLVEQINHFEQLIATKTTNKLSLENEHQSLNQDYEKVIEQINQTHQQNKSVSLKQNLDLQGQNLDKPDKVTILKVELDSLGQTIHNLSINEKTQIKHNEIIKQERDKLYETIDQLQFKINNITHELLRIDTKINILQEQKQNRTNLFKGVKTILENAKIFPNLHGIVADLLDVNPLAKQAIEVILSNNLQNLVVDYASDAIKAINFLKSNHGGRASFILLQEISPKYINPDHLQIAYTQSGFVDLASNLITTKPQYDVLVKYLLGNILVVKTIEDGANIFKIFNNYTIVSLDGNIIRSNKVMTGGSLPKTHNLLNSEQEIIDLSAKKPPLEANINALKHELITAQTHYNEKIALLSENNWELATLNQKITAYQTKYQLLSNQYETLAQTKFISQTNYEYINNDIDALENKRHEIKVLIKTKRQIVTQLNHELSTLVLQKNDSDKSLRDLMTDYGQMESAQNQAKYIMNHAQARLAEEYAMTFESAQDVPQLTIEQEAARKVVSTIKQELKELGNVNLDAIKDYEIVNTRWEKNEKNREELFLAQQTILNAISQMDEIIINRLDDVVKSVNQEISSIFKVMFGGGSANLKYTLPHNLLETGIEVEAKLPGKTIKNIKLFSGGEKSLVAISLLFAILKSRPLPLCILDEVEAALDDTNVIRYANFLQELKHKTQFIVVTHRIGTMTKMDKLFGATMQKRGVTSFFAVELAQAKNLIIESQGLS